MTNFTLTKRVAYSIHTYGTSTCVTLCPDLCPLSASCIDERLRRVRRSRYQDLHSNSALPPLRVVIYFSWSSPFLLNMQNCMDGNELQISVAVFGSLLKMYDTNRYSCLQLTL